MLQVTFGKAEESSVESHTVKITVFVESCWLLQFLNSCSLIHPSSKIDVKWGT